MLLAVAIFAAVLVLAAVVFKAVDARVGSGPAAVSRRLDRAPGFTARGWRRHV